MGEAAKIWCLIGELECVERRERRVWVWITGRMKATDTEGPKKWEQIVGIKEKEEHFGKIKF